MKFVDRQSEIQHLTSYLSSEPNALLFVYGPKSNGKSTLLKRVVTELEGKAYAINFLDLREMLIYCCSLMTFGVTNPMNKKLRQILRVFTGHLKKCSKTTLQVTHNHAS